MSSYPGYGQPLRLTKKVAYVSYLILYIYTEGLAIEVEAPFAECRARHESRCEYYMQLLPIIEGDLEGPPVLARNRIGVDDYSHLESCFYPISSAVELHCTGGRMVHDLLRVDGALVDPALIRLT
jgi:hypothetical protein